MYMASNQRFNFDSVPRSRGISQIDANHYPK